MKLGTLRSFAMVRPDYDDVPLQARPLHIRQTVRDAVVAEFLNLRLLKSRHQSFSTLVSFCICFTCIDFFGFLMIVICFVRVFLFMLCLFTFSFCIVFFSVHLMLSVLNDVSFFQVRVDIFFVNFFFALFFTLFFCTLRFWIFLGRRIFVDNFPDEADKSIRSSVLH